MAALTGCSLPRLGAEKLAGARRERSVRRHHQGCRPLVLKTVEPPWAHAPPCRLRLQDGVDLLFQVSLGLVADDPIGRFAAAEQDQAGDTEHAELRRRLRIGVDVEFGDRDPAGILSRQLFHHRPEHLAGRAPGRPEVEEHDLLGSADRRLEILIGNLDDVLRRHAAPSLALLLSSVLAGGAVDGVDLPESGAVFAFVSAFPSGLASTFGASAGVMLPSLDDPLESVL